MTNERRVGRSTRTRGVVFLLAIAVLAAGCGSSRRGEHSSGTTPGGSGTNVVKAASGPPHTGGRLVFGLDAETDGWSTTTNRWATAGLTVANAVFDPLAAWDVDFHAQPFLAKSIDHNDTYDVWTIRVRPGVTFHDGEPVDAAAIKKNLEAIKTAVLTAAAFQPVNEIKVVDPLTAEVDMSIPWSAFPASLTAQAGMIVAPKTLDDASEAALHPVGSGPFVFDKWSPDAAFSANRNPSYWRKDANGVQLPYVEAIDFMPIPDPQSAFDALRTGDVNLMTTSNQLIIKKLKSAAADGDIQYVQSTGETEETSVMLNTAKAPLDDIRVRTALAYATDQKAISAISGANPEDTAAGPFVPGTHWADDTGYPSFDLAKAKDLVAQVEAEKGPISFALQCLGNSETLQTCQGLAAMWGDAGIEVSIGGVDQAKLINDAVTGQYQATIWRQFGEPDPDGDEIWWNGANSKPPIALNMSRNSDPVLDAALYVGRTSADDSQRKLAYITVQRQLAKDVPYVWLSHVRWGLGAQNTVRGIDSATLPDNGPAAVMVGGVEKVAQVWLDT